MEKAYILYRSDWYEPGTDASMCGENGHEEIELLGVFLDKKEAELCQKQSQDEIEIKEVLLNAIIK